MSPAETAIDQLHRDLALSKQASRPDAEAVVLTTQATAREVLLEIERLRDRIQNPQFHHYTMPLPKLTKKQRRQAMENSPVPVIPWKDYGNPRHG